MKDATSYQPQPQESPDWQEFIEAEREITPEEEQERHQEKMSAFIGRLESEARRRVQKRYRIEERWIEDLRQYHGVYSPELLGRMAKGQKSQVFINQTAVKTDALEARLWDLLFPTDDRNWGVSPTPVPQLTEAAEAASSEADEAREVADAQQEQMKTLAKSGDETGAKEAEEQMNVAAGAEEEAQGEADRLHDILNEAKRRAELMQEEIDDQLVTCGFTTEARDAIGDACKLGVGILKGPVLGDRTKQKWRPANERPENGMEPETGSVAPMGHNGGPSMYTLETIADNMPAAYRVDPWSFFPDPEANRVADCNGFYERHMMSKMKLRQLAKRPDIDKEALRDLLKGSPNRGEVPTFFAELQDITSQSDGAAHEAYAVWEYTGPVDSEDMELLMEAFSKHDEAADPEELDVLEDYHARIWFCQGKCLSFALHPLDSNEAIYSVFNIRSDELGLFGFGIPYIMRHPQSVLNGAFRMMMDNAALSTGPQVVVSKDQVTPEDGTWELKPGKIWLRNTAQAVSGVPAFESFNIPSNQAELASIIEIALKFVDDVTAMPAIAQGEQGSGVTKTAQGMALLMNSANVTFRRIVKNYDDDMTVSMIRRFYHWNMQFSEKEEIKGDYDCEARGSGVLLVREMQAQNLLMIAQMFGDHPVYGPMLKHGDLLRHIFKAHMISSDDITKSEREFKQYLNEQAEQGDPAAEALAKEIELKEQEIELRRDEMDLKSAMNEKEWASRERIAQLSYDTAMERTAAQLNMSREQLDAKIEQGSADTRSSERKLAAEIAMAEKTGKSSGGAV